MLYNGCMKRCNKAVVFPTTEQNNIEMTWKDYMNMSRDTRNSKKAKSLKPPNQKGKEEQWWKEKLTGM
jgi:hypothetical protein